MDIIEQAFKRLYPDKDFPYSAKIRYSGKFKEYNANIRLCNDMLELRLSKSWRHINKEIKIGLVQSLLLKIFKDKKDTTNTDIYNFFIKKLHISAPKTGSHPILEDSFNRVNERYFYGILEQPNLCWGCNSIRKLGSYEYQTDTITISRIFEGEDPELLDYVMYHELLHKKHKFRHKNGRNYHHTRLFRQAEKQFENAGMIESKIKLLTSKHPKNAHSPFFNLIKRNFSFFNRKL